MEDPPYEGVVGAETYGPPVALTRPKSSPYCTRPVALRVGPSQKEYHVPKDLLQTPRLIAPVSWSPYIALDLPDVDEDMGHVLAHYLHTGAYQTLDNVENHDGPVEFKRAVLTYGMAKTYALPGLHQLAMREIVKLGADIPTFTTVESMDEYFAKLPQDITWLRGYLKERLANAFEEDHTAFARDEFFGKITNVDFHRFLAQTVVELFNVKLSNLLSAGNTAPDSTPRDYASEVCVPEDVPPLEHDLLGLTPATELPREPEDDPWGWGLPAGKKKKKKKALPVVSIEAPIEPERVTEGPPPEPTVEIEPSPDDDWGTSHVSTKKKKGKKTVALVQQASEPPPPPPPEPEDDPWGSFVTTGKKKKKALPIDNTQVAVEPETVIEEPAPEPTVEVEPSPDYIWRTSRFSTRKKRGKMTVASTQQVEESPPPPPPEPEDDKWGFHIGTTKKKSKRAMELAQLVEECLASPPPEPETTVAPEPEPVAEDNWGTIKKKKTKKPVMHSTVVEEPIEEEPAPVIEGPVIEEIVIVKKSKKKAKKVCIEEPPAEEQPPPIPEPEVVPDKAFENPMVDTEKCTVRVNKLLKGDHWRKCSKCRAIVQDVAMLLARMNSPDSEEYEMVNN